MIEPNDITMKFLKNSISSWDREWEGMRKKLINHFKKVSKQLKKIRNEI